MKLSILYDSSHYLVCAKPHGVESEKQLPRLLCEQTGLECLYPIHRLDKETAGVILFAKTKEDAAYFSHAMQQGAFEKTYIAVVKGAPSESQGEFTDLLFRDKQKNKSYIVKRMRKGVKEATLSYRVLASVMVDDVPHSLMEITLGTGRTHQIRVQFASRKMPLLGDKKYGGNPYSNLCLVAKSLTFPQPNSHEPTTCCYPPEEIHFPR